MDSYLANMRPSICLILFNDLECLCVRVRPLLLFPILVGCATAVSTPKLDPCSVVQCVADDRAGVRIADNKLVVGDKILTPQFKAIQSFDVSTERREVVFSARRDSNFDIGLVSLDGSQINWIPEDPANETDVQWAPKGNKVSYIVHAPTGDLVRTVHIPTAVQVSVAFPFATVRRLAWDREAERYAVVLTSPDASDRIESMKYDGTARRTDVAAKSKLDVIEEPFGGGLLMRPSAVRYGEKLPLVVWVADPPFVWNESRGALMRDKRVACAIMRHAPDAAFLDAVRAVPWIDGSQIAVRGSQ